MAPLILSLLLIVSIVVAQSPSQSQNTSHSLALPANVTQILTDIPVTRSSLSAGSTVQFTQLVSTTILSTISTPSPTSTAPPHNATGTNSTNTYTGPVLDTVLDPAFGVLGALLVLTGLPSAFLGHKNRWSSFFLTGFYSLSLACLCLILKYGVLVAVHPPNKTLRGLFVLACGVAGVAGGGISIFFWQQTKYFIGAWGGFALGLWVQCFRNSGLIRPIGFRWILYIGCAVIGFVLCTVPKLHYHVLIAGTAITGASAFMLGVDCFTTAGLKEFYVYNLGFSDLFPKFSQTGFALSQVMEVELGLVAAVALMGVAVQLRVLVILKRKLREINAEERKREAAAEAKAVMRFEHVQQDLEDWEKEHGRSAGRPESGFSGTPLMKDVDEPSTPEGESTVIGVRPRTRSGISELALGGNEDGRPVSRFNQNPGLLPAMNLGLGLDSELPGNLISDEKTSPVTRMQHPDLLKKEELLAEIQTIRKSIDALRSEASSQSGDSRHPSMSMHSRTRSSDGAVARVQAGEALPRVRSMDLFNEYLMHGNKSNHNHNNSGSNSSAARGLDIARPRSTPLRAQDSEWEAYLRERKLFQPPSGPSAPIATTVVAPVPRPVSAFLSVPDAVTDALARRQRRESAFELGGPSGYIVEAQDPSGGGRRHRRSASIGPVTILPPKTRERGSMERRETTTTPTKRTFEELVERHQEKMRAMQGPLSRREKEAVELESAKRRWEKTRRMEREEVGRRRAEREAAIAKKGTGIIEAGPKRTSMAKVQEWQRYQREVDKAGQQENVPFPGQSRSGGRQARDPPS